MPRRRWRPRLGCNWITRASTRVTRTVGVTWCSTNPYLKAFRCRSWKIVVQGMHPEPEVVGFALPHPPSVAFTVEGNTVWLPPQLTNVLIEPAKPAVHLTYVVRREELPRVFIPGIHVKIPMSIQVNGDVPVHYEPPASLYGELQKARAKGAG